MCKEAQRNDAKKICRLLFWEGDSKGYKDRHIADHTGCAPKTAEHYRYGSALPSLPVFIATIELFQAQETLGMIAEMCGCLVIPKPAAECKTGDVLSLSSDVMKQDADLLNTLAAALDDNVLTPAEKKKLKEKIKQGYQALARLEASL